jgi:O-antigen/teichoic acid export membrane protein
VTTKVDEQLASPNPATSPVAEESLRRRVVRVVGWEVAGQFGTQAWRFATNLVNTRLLVPEAFGLIGIVQVFMMGITLLSDIGLQSSVIHDKRGEDRRFLDTVWSVGIIRGLLIWLASCAFAKPIAVFFDMPELVWLLPVTGLSAIARSLASTSLLTASRNLRNDWYVRVDCGSQIIGTTISVALAFWLRSVLALALGWISVDVVFAILSYCHRGVRFNRFCWDRQIARSLSRFGRWAMASGGFTVLQQRGDRLALGKIISTADLGAYVIASNLAILPMTIFQRLNLAVSQPVYARVRHLPLASARSKMRRLRMGILLAHVPMFVVLVVFGQPLVDFLYESEYRLAGWYCSLASLAMLVRVGADPGPVYLAHGDSWTHFKITTVKTISLIVSMLAGYFVGRAWNAPDTGLLYGVVVAPLFSYPYQSIMYRRLNAWFPEIDTIAFASAGLLVVAQLAGLF